MKTLSITVRSDCGVTRDFLCHKMWPNTKLVDTENEKRALSDAISVIENLPSNVDTYVMCLCQCLHEEGCGWFNVFKRHKSKLRYTDRLVSIKFDNASKSSCLCWVGRWDYENVIYSLTYLHLPHPHTHIHAHIDKELRIYVDTRNDQNKGCGRYTSHILNGHLFGVSNVKQRAMVDRSS